MANFTKNRPKHQPPFQQDISHVILILGYPRFTPPRGHVDYDSYSDALDKQVLSTPRPAATYT
eukprot:7391876-Prymnesium_polylepis.3